ncbi:MAG: hypothetical protein U5O39_04135 [Gammaproteobacteria bacterium]|nr:hypothetical protein [Gammaproteobacteria bacterium]
MPTLQTLDANASRNDVLATMDRDGACILADQLDAAAIDGLLAELMPWVEATRYGGDDFSGRHTRRTGALVARTPSCRPVVTHPSCWMRRNPFWPPIRNVSSSI